MEPVLPREPGFWEPYMAWLMVPQGPAPPDTLHALCFLGASLIRQKVLGAHLPTALLEDACPSLRGRRWARSRAEVRVALLPCSLLPSWVKGVEGRPWEPLSVRWMEARGGRRKGGRKKGKKEGEEEGRKANCLLMVFK